MERGADGSYLLNQKQKKIELVKSLGLQDAHTVTTPMQTCFLKNRDEGEQKS